MNKQIFKKKIFCNKAKCLPLLLVIVGALSYINSLNGPFIFDDEPNILYNYNIRSLWPLGKAISPPAMSGLGGRPILSLSLALNYAISGYSVWSYHAVNLVIHILAGLTLYGIVRRTLLGDRLKDRFGAHAAVLAWIIAAIWVVHPIQTESVTYVIQRAESLMGLFYLMTLYTAVLAMQSQRPAVWSVMSAFCCGLGMVTKEVTVTAPVIVLLYDRAFVSGSFVSALRRRWGLYALLAATWGLLAIAMWSSPSSETVGFSTGISASDYALNQCIVIVRYLRLCLWPTKLCLFYNWPIVKDFGRILPPMLFILAILGTTAWGLIRNHWWAYLSAWFFVILAPTSSFVPIKDLAFEHRVYLPLAGPVALLVAGGYILLQKLAKRFHRSKETGGSLIKGGTESCLGIILVIAIITMLILTTISRNKDYQSAASIWQTVIDVVPDNHRAYYNLGIAFKAQGNLDEAIRQYRKALDLKPNYAKAYCNLGEAFRNQGNLGEAVLQYRKALHLKPKFAIAHHNLGVALSAQGKLNEAVSHYRQAIQINPNDALLYNGLGSALQSQGKFDKAISNYRQALQINPKFVSACNNLGMALQLQDRLDEAISYFRQALQINPDLASANNNLAWVLATAKDTKFYNPTEAVKFALRACELTEYNNPNFLDTLAVAYAAAGRFAEAVKYAEKAVDLATSSNQLQLAEEIKGRLEFYKNGKAYRDSAK
ncbi:MAG: tetratricopeptide repeat protein [Planctomycetota bacterium]|jgi:tetratricopeptide (TPR) repeat protein